MSVTPIKLNRARKDRARAASRRKADENAVRFGRTKAQRASEADDANTALRKIDAHKRDPDKNK